MTPLPSDRVKKAIEVPPLKGNRQSVNWSANIRQAMAEFEQTLRILYFLDFNRSRESYTIKFHFEHIQSKRDRDYCYKYGHAKFISLANSWKHRTLKAFQGFIKKVSHDKPDFRRATKKEVIETKLSENYQIDDFCAVFDFTRGHINFNRSNKKVARWCKIIWVDLSTCLKMAYNLENKIINKNNPAPHLEKYTISWIRNHWDKYGSFERYNVFRPGTSDIQLARRSIPRKVKAAQKATINQDKEKDLYIEELYEDEETQEF